MPATFRIGLPGYVPPLTLALIRISGTVPAGPYTLTHDQGAYSAVLGLVGRYELRIDSVTDVIVRVAFVDLVDGEQCFPQSSIDELNLLLGGGSGGGGGGCSTGQFLVPLTIKNSLGNIVPYCEVVLTSTNLAQSNDVIDSGRCSLSGKIEFRLNPGVYYGWRNLPTYEFNDPFTLTVNSSGIVTIS